VAVVSTDKKEFSRLEVLLRVQSGGLRAADACEPIGLHRRQVFRLLRGLRQDGAASLLSKRRGKPGNHRLPAEVCTLALSIVRDRYADFGPSLAAEKLAEHHGCRVSRETRRGWMIAAGLWQDRRHCLLDQWLSASQQNPPPTDNPWSTAVAAHRRATLATISNSKARGIHLWLLDLSGECSGRGISELMLIKALMAEPGHKISHRTIANIGERARLAGAA
jgi:Winged helix-turn helix